MRKQDQRPLMSLTLSTARLAVASSCWIGRRWAARTHGRGLGANPANCEERRMEARCRGSDLTFPEVIDDFVRRQERL